jgi:hypothetical protein
MTPCKILIIDDDADDVQLLADVFHSCGVDRVPGEAVIFVVMDMEIPDHVQRLTPVNGIILI